MADLADLLATDQARLWLANHEMTMLYRYLNRRGVSQPQIAELTGQWEGAVSSIAAGRRVESYDLLVRIANGLSVPRGWLGVAHDDETAGLLIAAQIAHE